MDSPASSVGPLWLDVDTGVDDALAIAYAVRSGHDVVGVSTVAGNVSIDLATENTRRVLAWVGAAEVSVYRGASRPLAAPFHDAAHVHGADGLGGADLGEQRAPLHALSGVEAILQAADEYAGNLVLVALGPLTNIAMVLSLRPAFASQVGRLVIMSGAFQVAGNVTEHAEFNAFADPHAAAQVMSAEWPSIVAVGLDVTHQTVVARDQWERTGDDAAPTADLVRRVAARTFGERGMDAFYLHDPLAVGVALGKATVETEAWRIEVATDDLHRGRTTPAGSGTVHVATAVDAGGFERDFATRMGIPVGRRGDERLRAE